MRTGTEAAAPRDAGRPGLRPDRRGRSIRYRLGDAASLVYTKARQTAFDGPEGDGYSGYEGVKALLGRGVPAHLITMSSDCNGSLPEFDADGALIGMAVASNGPLIDDWRRLVLDGVLELEPALGLIGGNVARVLGLSARKGRIFPGFDADVTLLDEELRPRLTFARGRCLWRAE